LRPSSFNLFTRDQDIELLDQLPMFRPLSLPAIERLADLLEPLAFEAGHQVVTQGDEGDRFYVIEQGTVEVVQNGAITGALAGGDCFGEIALLRNVPRTSSVVATTPLRVQSLARDDFLCAIAGPAASRVAAEQLVSHRLDLVARAERPSVPPETADVPVQDL